MIPADFNPHRKLDSRAQAQSVLDETIEQSRLVLRIFDDNGQYYGFGRLSFAIALGSFLTRDKAARATLIFHDCSHIERHCPRLVEMLRRFSPQLQVLKSGASMRSFSRGLAIGDHGVLLVRPHFGHDATFVDYDEHAVATAQSLFGEIEQLAEPGLSGQVTGL